MLSLIGSAFVAAALSAGTVPNIPDLPDHEVASSEDCRVIRHLPNGKRIVKPATRPDRARRSGAVAVSRGSGNGSSSVSVSSSSGGSSRASASSSQGGRTVSTTNDDNGCTIVIDDRSRRGGRR